MSHSAAGDTWDIVRYVFKHHDELMLDPAFDGELPAYTTIRKKIDKELPEMKFDYAFKTPDTGNIRTIKNRSVIERKKACEEKMYEIGAIDVGLKLHTCITPVQLQETKSFS